MVAVRSETMLILMFDGIEACSTGIIALMRSTVAMDVGPGRALDRQGRIAAAACCTTPAIRLVFQARWSPSLRP